MFEQFQNLPLHVLVIHLAVVVLPVSALTAIAFVALPKWRRLLRWPALVLGVGALACAFVAKKSGDAFVTALPQLLPLVRLHRSRGNLLLWFVLAFAVLVVAAILLLGRPTALGSATNGKPTVSRPLELLLIGAVVVMAVVVIYQTILTGDAGARAIWGNILPKK
ncbi:hypothetical protein PWY87_15160 [Kribbella solani]|uniref:DUF2231 domain-containing protein n=1 Tax=Kribbella solani TaxID=236067 RepID=UPI0029BF2636|nr:DUF2231 domain-containing protein [Kribbella solani]MDX2974196.1 hypothetical protein [Kribbella solani]MDX3003025.1 hypothetical protein [Kribbella solani]